MSMNSGCKPWNPLPRQGIQNEIISKKAFREVEGIFNTKSTKRRFARVIYDASSGFDPSTLKLDAEVVILLPDNGMRVADEEEVDFSKNPYQIFYD